MHVFVTGGSGYIGRNVIRSLIKRGDTVHALARSVQAGELIVSLGGTVFAGDVTDRNALTQGMADCDAVIHCAALVKTWGNPIDFHRVNVTGTQQVLAACHTAKIPRLIYLSTASVLADGKPKIHIDETTPYARKPIGLYPLTQSVAEKMVIGANCPTLQTVVIRLHRVWGKDDTVWLPRLIDRIERGVWFWVNRGHHLTSSCHIDNVVQGILLALEKGDGGEIYALTDGAPIELRNFITNILLTQNITPPDRSIPGWLGMNLARISEFVVRRFNLERNPPLIRMELATVSHEFTINDQKAREELGYRGTVSREQGLADLAQRNPSYTASK